MAASILGLFGNWEFGKRTDNPPDRPRPVLRGEYAEALCAGWVPPLPVAPSESHAPVPTSAQEADADEFLTRVYRYQQC